MKNALDFGNTLKELRKERGYTQKRLAEILNVSETTISKYESNIVVPPFETVRTIAAWFNISIDSLAGNEPPHYVSLYGLNDKQTDIIQKLIELFVEKNTTILNITNDKQYELLGRITESLLHNF